MVKKAIFVAALVMGAAAVSSAKNTIRLSHPAQPAFRVELRGNATVLSKDQPVRRGSVVLFHRFPDGRLTSVPAEDVAAVVSDRPYAASGAPLGPAPTVPLRPGDAVLLGPTGEGISAAVLPAAPGPPSPSGDIPSRLALDAQVFPGDLPAPSASGTPGGTGAMLNGMPLYGGSPANTVINPTLGNGGSAAAAAQVPTNIGPNGFPTTTATGPGGGVQPINPNGFPATTTTGPQSGVLSINPNGFPATTTGPQSGVQPIDPNGFPALNVPPTSGMQGATTASSAPAGTAGSTAAAAAATRASTVGRTSTARGPGAVGTTTTVPANSSAVGAPVTNNGGATTTSGPTNTSAVGKAPGSGQAAAGSPPTASSTNPQSASGSSIPH